MQNLLIFKATFTWRTLPVTLGAFFLFAYVSVADAQNREGNVIEGRVIAQDLCSRCHAIDPSQVSPNPEAPPFQEVAGRWPLSHLEEALAEGISVGHEAMPEFVLNTREIDNLLAYLSSLTR